MQLLFIRHAQSLGNQAGRMQGHSDAPLSVMGQQQAEALGTYLRQQSWKPTHIYASPLRRAIETAERLLASLIVPDPESAPALEQKQRISGEAAQNQSSKSTFKTTDSEATAVFQPEFGISEPRICPHPDLREQGLGILEDLTWAEAQTQYPELCQQLEADHSWLPIPGAETLQEGRDRAAAFIQSVLKRHVDGDRLWIISHSGILQHLISVLLGSDRTWGLTIPNGALFEFAIALPLWQTQDQNRWNGTLWQIQRFNETPVYARRLRENPHPVKL